VRKEVIGNATLYLGDSMEILPSMSEVACVITDPPYGVSYISGRYKQGNPFGAIKSDDITNAAWLAFAVPLLRDAGAIYSCARWDVLGVWKGLFEFFGLAVKNCIVWDKEHRGMGDLSGAYAPTHEMVLMGVRGKHVLRRSRPSDVVRVRRIGTERSHPTEKPVELFTEFVLNSTDLGDSVLDPFMGSGAVGLASIAAGRSFIGIEIEERYFDAACERISKTQERLFA
jgi:site-specific DNA-methyltransferase (adenine-specific)